MGQPIGFVWVQKNLNINKTASRGDMECFMMEDGSYNFLYDKTMKEYKNTEMMKAVWELIGKKFAMSGELNKFIFIHQLSYHSRIPLSRVVRQMCIL